VPRPAGRHTAAPPGRVPSNLPPKPEPGKPIYVRKPDQRTRPLVDKRFEEGERKLHPVRARVTETARRATPAERPAVAREPREITITEGITVRELAQKLDLRAKDLLKELVDGGILATINQVLDTPTATRLAGQFNATVKEIPFEEQLVEEEVQESRPEGQKPRAPVVTVMGHVDHGKTSLLDTIRQAKVAEGEAGGITQHIGAYEVQINGKRVVFIDTPGHEAFTRMRARGAGVTDIVVLVVAADDGVMPQTREAIDHARAAKVPIVVAVNKIDKPDAQPERVKRQLADLGLMPEEWGGDTVFVEVSAKTGQNVDKLLEMIALVGELRELKANPDMPASGVVLESRLDKGRGPVATLLVQNGTLHVGDSFICGAVYGKVRAMYDDRAQAVKRATPSTPVEILGLQGVPEAGDRLLVADEARARHISEYRLSKLREASLARTAGARLTLDQLQEQLRAGEVKELPIVVKADVQGSVEVLADLLPKLSTDKVRLDIILSSVGAVSESDVLLASASKAIIIAFNVRPDRKAIELAEHENVEIRSYSVIYELTDDVKKLMTGLLEPVLKETVLGHADVRETFRIKGVGMIAGCRVADGIIRRDANVRVVRDGVLVYSGKVQSLRRFKEDVNEVRGGFECGVGVSNFNDVKVGDVLECFTVEKIAVAQPTA
jgi:translation initiation factor IF-2